MYYRIAIQQESSLDLHWKSTILSSLDSLFLFLRLCATLSQEHLRVFSSLSRENLAEQFAQERLGFSSHSVTVAQFLQERRICPPEVARRTVERGAVANQKMASTPLTLQPFPVDSRGLYPMLEKGMSFLERRRVELEAGEGGDHDVAYRFTLPTSTPEMLAWIKLQAKIQNSRSEAARIGSLDVYVYNTYNFIDGF